MSNCELCGKKTDLVTAYVDNVRFKVCSGCSKYGKVIETDIKEPEKKYIMKREEIAEVVVDNYSKIIKNSRDKLGLTQKDFALKLNEKESLIAKLEQGSLKPDIELAKKLERFFSIKLVIQEKIDISTNTKIKDQKLTIGDVLKK